MSGPPARSRLGRWPRIVGAAASAGIVVAVTLTLVGVGATGGGSGTGNAAAGRSPARADTHGYPRTLSFAKCGYENDVARRDMVVGGAYCNIEKLRKLNPRGIFLLQPGLYPSGTNPKGEADYGGMNVTYGSGLYYWTGGCDDAPGGVDLGCMRAFDFDVDFMHNADGSVAGIGNGTSGHRGWNIAEPIAKGTRELVAKVTAYAAKLDGLYRDRWSGIFSDNWIYGVIGASYAYGPNLDTDLDGTVDDQDDLRKRWDNALNEIGGMLASFLPGKTVAGNGNWLATRAYHGDDPNGWLKSADGTMVEGIERYYDDAATLLKISSRWLSYPSGQPRYLMFLQDALTDGGERLTAPSDVDPNTSRYMLDPGVMRSMRWGLTLALMAGAYYELLLDGHHATLWWYDEYDGGRGIRRRGYLGRALGPAVAVREGVWRRSFQHGIALNNSTGRTVTIDLRRPYRHLRGTQNPQLNDGSVVRKVTLAGHDGVILLTAKE